MSIPVQAGVQGAAPPVPLRVSERETFADKPSQTWENRAERKHLARTYAAALARFTGPKRELKRVAGNVTALVRKPLKGRSLPAVQGELTHDARGRLVETISHRVTTHHKSRERETPEEILRSTVQALRGCARDWVIGETPKGQQVVEGVWLCHNLLCPTCAILTQQTWVRRLHPLFAHAGTTERQYTYRQKNGRKIRIPGVWVDLKLDATGHVLWDGAEDWIRLRKAQRREDLALRAEGRRDRQALTRYTEQARALLDRDPQVVRLYAFFVTLTVRNQPHIWQDATDTDPGGSRLDAALNKPWRTLRETARRRPKSAAGRFMAQVKGGADVTEITWSKAKGFHGHKHALVLADVPYLSKDALRKLWADYTDGEGQIVDVRPFYKAVDLETGAALLPEKAVSELLKYLVKPQAEMDPAALREVVLAMRGRRRVNTWGCLRELPPAEPEEALNPPETPAVMPEGRHVRYHYMPNGRRYRRAQVWRATAADPIIPIGRGPDPAPYSTRDDITPSRAEHDRAVAAVLAGRPLSYGQIDDRRFALEERTRRRAGDAEVVTNAHA